MTDSKAPWLARGSAIALMMAAGIALAACSGGESGLNEDEEATLQLELELAEARAAAAEDAKKKAEDDKEAAKRLLQAAETRRQQEEQRRRDAETAREQAEEEAEAARQQVTRGDARLVLEGLEDEIAPDAGGTTGVTVEPRHNATARITAIDPATTFVNPTTGSLLGWRKTAFAKNERPNIDRLEVYSNVEAPTSLPFRDSDYNDGIANDDDIADLTVVAPFESTEGTRPTVVIDQQGTVVGWLDIEPGSANAREDAASSAFPRSSGLPMTYTLIDQGQYTTVDRDDNSVPPEYRGPIRNPMVDPQRYEFERSGTLGGASGTYRCASDTLETCSVQNTGNTLVFVGPWTFRPSSASSRVRIADEAYMYFGWWSRHATETPAWSFHTFHGGHPVGNIDGVTGSATYRGPAAGYYAIYEPNSAGSEYGDFTATASLTADFTNDWVQGTIDQFSGHPNWSLTLERLTINDGAGDALRAMTALPGQLTTPPLHRTSRGRRASTLTSLLRTGRA